MLFLHRLAETRRKKVQELEKKNCGIDAQMHGTEQDYQDKGEAGSKD